MSQEEQGNNPDQGHQATSLRQMTPQDYISDRLQQYQSWYDKKSVKTKAIYLRMRMISVVGGALVPVFVNLSFPGVRAATTVLSLVVVISVALESVFRYREQWKNYRSTEQFLGHERIHFETRTGVYLGKDDRAAFELLVDRVEGAIAAENSATLNVLTVASQETGDEPLPTKRGPR